MSKNGSPDTTGAAQRIISGGDEVERSGLASLRKKGAEPEVNLDTRTYERVTTEAGLYTSDDVYAETANFWGNSDKDDDLEMTQAP